MTEFYDRDFNAELSIRSDGTGRTIHGLVVPFGVTARVSDGGPSYEEEFQFGAFAKHLSERTRPVKLLSQHMARSNPLGVSTSMREDPSGLYGEFRVSKTPEGDAALELVRDGALDGFSIGFGGIKHVRRAGVVVRTEALIREASLVTFGAYPTALVAGVRALSDDDLTALAQRMSALQSSLLTLSEPSDTDTSIEAVLSGSEPLPQHSVRNLHLSLRALAREKGVL